MINPNSYAIKARVYTLLNSMIKIFRRACSVAVVWRMKMLLMFPEIKKRHEKVMTELKMGNTTVREVKFVSLQIVLHSNDNPYPVNVADVMKGGHSSWLGKSAPVAEVHIKV